MIVPSRVVWRALVVLASSLTLIVAAQAGPEDRSLQLDEQLEQKIEQAVAYVSVEYNKPNSTRRYIDSGSGFFVAPGYLVTNHHVVVEGLQAREPEMKIRVFSGTPQARFYPIEVLKTDPEADLALLRVIGEPPAVESLRIDPQIPGKQSEVFAFGFPLGTMLDRSKNGPNVCLRRGYVSRMLDDGTSIEADMNIDKGISGGPLVDVSGMVRGVVRAMAGSNYSKAYAAISVAAPVLLNFCQTAGCRVTLSSGEFLEPSTTRHKPNQFSMEESDPRPRVGFADDILRACFSIGTSLRLSSLVPQILASQKTGYTAEIRQSSRGNADLVLANLKRVEAPKELQTRANELLVLLSKPQTEPKLVGEKSMVLEQACDEWVSTVDAEQKLNYDLGAWLTELSLGLLDVKSDKDLRSCAYFIEHAQAQEATSEITATLQRLHKSLEALKQKDTENLRRAITKDADRLIGIGYLATAGSGLNPLPKHTSAAPSTGGGNNIIRVPQ